MNVYMANMSKLSVHPISTGEKQKQIKFCLSVFRLHLILILNQDKKTMCHIIMCLFSSNLKHVKLNRLLLVLIPVINGFCWTKMATSKAFVSPLFCSINS